MGIGAKDIQACVCRILHLSIRTGYRFVQKHPFAFGVFLFLFLLYIYLPFVFNFLASFAPVLICVAILLRILWSSEQSHVKSVKGDEKRTNAVLDKKTGSGEYDVIVNSNDCSSWKTETSRRRNVKEENKELGVRSDRKEQEMVLQTTSNEDSIGKTAPRKAENSPFEHGESSYASGSAANYNLRDLDQHHAFLDSEHFKLMQSSGAEQKGKCDVAGTESEVDNLEEADDEDEEEEAQEDGENAMEWTEDDQKNLMDLGLSELERNRRLESLIVKRRTRKLCRMQAEKGLIDLRSVPASQFAPIYVARNETNDVSNVLDEIEGLEAPDSAPSILIATQNPFDLPYDPLEERPNLLGDSFQEEFTAPQKEMPFCRHESFSMGPSLLLESKQDQHDTKSSSLFVSKKGLLEGPGYLRFIRRPNIGDHDHLLEQQLHKEGDHISHVDGTPDVVETGGLAPNQVTNSVETTREEDTITTSNNINIKREEDMERPQGMRSMSSNKSEVHAEPTEDCNDGSNLLSSAEEKEQIFNAQRGGVSESLESNLAQKPIRFSLPEPESGPLYDSIPRANDENRRDHRNFFAGRGSSHASTCSMDSDLQVEVSEVGSPPPTVEGTNSPIDGVSTTYYQETEKEIASGSEETSGVSSQQSGAEESELKFGGIHEEDIVERGLAGFNRHSYSIDSDLQVEVSDVGSPPPILPETSGILSQESEVEESELKFGGIHEEDIVEVGLAGLNRNSNSIDADLQVEVSEVGSPPPTVDGTNSPIDGGDSKTYYQETGKEIASGSGESSGVSSQQSGAEGTELKCGGIHEEESVEVGFAAVNRNSNSIASDLQVEVSEVGSPPPTVEGTSSPTDGDSATYKEETESVIPSGSGEMLGVSSQKSRVEDSQDSTDISPLSSSTNSIDISCECQLRSINISCKIHDDVNHVKEKVGDPESKFPNSLDPSSTRNLKKATQSEVVAHLPHEVYSEKTKDFSYPREITTEELNAVCDFNHKVHQATSDLEELKMNEDSHGGWQPVNNEETEKPSQHHATSCSEKPIEGNSKLIGDVGGNQVRGNEKESIVDMSKPIKAKDYSKSVQDSRTEHSAVVSGASWVIHNPDDPIASAAQQEPAIEEVPINSSLSASPKSTIIQDIGDEQSVMARGAFWGDKNSDDPIASAEQQDTMIQEVAINPGPSSSPKSALAEKATTDQASSSISNQKIYTDLHQSHLENTAKTSTLDEESPLNLTRENLNSIQESGDRKSVMVIQNSDDYSASAEQLELVTEEGLINSTSSSPTSVLAENTPIHQASSSNVNPTFFVNILQSHLEDTATNNALDEQSPMNLAPDNFNQDNGDEQRSIASGASGVNQKSDDPSASVEQQELVSEEVPINSSSSSPKSILAEKISIDQAPSSQSNKKLDIQILQSHREGIKRIISLDEQPPLNLTLTAPQDAQHMVEDSASGVNQKSDYPSAAAELQELVTEEVPINSSSSSPKSIIAEKIPIDQAPSSKSNKKLDMDILQSHLEGIERIISLDEQPPLNLTLTAPQDAQHIDPCNLAEKSPQETNVIDNLNEPMADVREEKENAKSYPGINGELETCGSHKVSTSESKLGEDKTNIPGTMESGKFTAEPKTTYKINDPVVRDMEDNNNDSSVGEGDDESQSFIKQKNSLELSEPDELTSSKLAEDSDEKSGTFTEGEALLGPSKSLEEIENLKTTEETEDSGKINEHHHTSTHLPKSVDTADNLYAMNNVGGESENLTEGEAPDPSKLATTEEKIRGGKNLFAWPLAPIALSGSASEAPWMTSVDDQDKAVAIGEHDQDGNDAH
ncbi:hypothetical protein CJ030_MR6G009082 [Morella rubra]|uniref:Uncharacterized protein n=1 Tax=Morella rubra TaxID=262757 RepID=A0A6A1VCR3_9ROSI|nr:hypothetical protein CJ030_MR6G009082 [Morella rubra]